MASLHFCGGYLAVYCVLIKIPFTSLSLFLANVTNAFVWHTLIWNWNMLKFLSSDFIFYSIYDLHFLCSFFFKFSFQIQSHFFKWTKKKSSLVDMSGDQFKSQLVNLLSKKNTRKEREGLLILCFLDSISWTFWACFEWVLAYMKWHLK